MVLAELVTDLPKVGAAGAVSLLLGSIQAGGTESLGLVGDRGSGATAWSGVLASLEGLPNGDGPRDGSPRRLMPAARGLAVASTVLEGAAALLVLSAAAEASPACALGKSASAACAEAAQQAQVSSCLNQARHANIARDLLPSESAVGCLFVQCPSIKIACTCRCTCRLSTAWHIFTHHSSRKSRF